MVVKMSENLIYILVSGSTGKMGLSLRDTLSQKKSKDDSVFRILEIVPLNFIENKEIWSSSIIIDFSEPSFSLATLEQAVEKKIHLLVQECNVNSSARMMNIRNCLLYTSDAADE